jgi:hypothetical protein
MSVQNLYLSSKTSAVLRQLCLVLVLQSLWVNKIPNGQQNCLRVGRRLYDTWNVVLDALLIGLFY